ncbi:hypothetical protein TRIP_E160119 [uncultured Spirochaetota bacterium]|nr:hypothetical protein TRIP_E160119 [uncultured Spirochaetota bacterium]
MYGARRCTRKRNFCWAGGLVKTFIETEGAVKAPSALL